MGLTGLGTQQQWLAMLAVLARIGAALAVTPPFAHLAVPRRVRILIAMALTVGLAPVGLKAAPLAVADTGTLVAGIGGEVLIGLALGMAISLVFAAASWTGELVSHQFGLNLAESYEPGSASGGDGSPLARAYWMLAVVVFFAANGHHALLHGLRGSFDAVPIFAATSGQAIVTMLVGLLESACGLALRLAAPAIVATLVADVALGFAGRTIPQLGGLVIGLPLRGMIGLIALTAGIVLTVGVLQGATVGWMHTVQTLIGGLAK